MVAFQVAPEVVRGSLLAAKLAFYDGSLRLLSFYLDLLLSHYKSVVTTMLRMVNGAYKK